MLKQFHKYFVMTKKDFIISIACVFFEATFELIIPMLMANIIDIGVVRRNKNYILQRGALMILCSMISLVLGVFYAHYAARAGQGFGAAVREDEYRKVQSFSFSNLDHFNTPSLITRLTSDITILQNTICNGLRPMVRGPIMMIMALSMSILMSPQLAIVFLIAMPILGICLFLIFRKIGPLYGKMQKALDKLNSVVQENLIAIRTVKSFVRGKNENQKFENVNGAFCNSSEQAFHYASLNLPCFQFVMYATILCILWFGGNLIHIGSMKVGALTGFLSYVLQILNSLMMISNVFLMLSRSTTSANRILEVLDEPVDIVGGTEQVKVEHGSIDFDHVSFKYRKTAKRDVLSDICLHIDAGQTVGIIGGTGAAKSSLVQLIPRLYDVGSGSLKIDGHDVREYPVAYLRDAVGMVLQKNTLFSGTIRENLKWGNPEATQEELDWACRTACVDEFLSRMPEGYDTDLSQGGVNLSGGQKQRLCIARALLKHPKILILDDSTSAVDTATEARIRAGLAQLRGTTILIISQRINSIEHADRIIVLEDGKINEVGTHDILLAHNRIYRDIYEIQKEGAIA